eukprot:gnl/Carplike_NY0171/4195_a5679_246.p1 GENE.gnl/Carplike_NY0171/4195_a5679_246~~gnl/Carplike_NY0171/4195_a5679_246.p1  ORF type:complete len:490 (-),score=129.77 gnl/Carplike_NY0171/4195_a5679_246:35-1360(-)
MGATSEEEAKDMPTIARQFVSFEAESRAHEVTKEKLFTLREKFEHMKEECEELRHERDKLHESYSKLADEQERMTQMLKEQQDKSARLASSRDSGSGAELRDTIRTQTGKIAELNTSLAQLRDKMFKAERCEKRVEDALSRLGMVSVDQWEAKYNATLESIQELRGSVEEYQHLASINADLRDKIATLSHENTRLLKEREAQVEKSEQLTQQVEGFVQAKVPQYERKLSTLSSETRVLTNELQTAMSDLRETKEKNEELRSLNREASRKLNDLIEDRTSWVRLCMRVVDQVQESNSALRRRVRDRYIGLDSDSSSSSSSGLGGSFGSGSPVRSGEYTFSLCSESVSALRTMLIEYRSMRERLPKIEKERDSLRHMSESMKRSDSVERIALIEENSRLKDENTILKRQADLKAGELERAFRFISSMVDEDDPSRSYGSGICK